MLLKINSIFGFLSLLAGVLYAHFFQFHLGHLDNTQFLTALHYNQNYSFFLIMLCLLYYGVVGFNQDKYFFYAICYLTIGSLLFCFSLYISAISHHHIPPVFAPVGGTLWIIGWLIFIRYCFKLSKLNQLKA